MDLEIFQRAGRRGAGVSTVKYDTTIGVEAQGAMRKFTKLVFLSRW